MQKEKRFLIFTLLILSCLKLPASPTDTGRVNDLNDLCFKNLYTDNDLAMRQAREALKLARQLRFQKGEANAYNRIGVVYDVLGDFDSALFFYKQAYELNVRTGNKKGQGSALSNMGLTYLNKGDYTNALSSFYTAIKPLESVSHYHYLGNCYNNIGLLYSDLRDSVRARVNFNRAIHFYTLGNRDYEKASVYCNLAILMAGAGQFDSAVIINRAAIKIYEREKDYYNLGKLYSNMANDLTELKDYEIAIESYLKAIEYHKLSENITGLGETMMYMAEMYEELKNKKMAEYYTIEAFKVSEKIRSPKVVSNIYYHYALIRMMAGDHKTAAEYLKRVKLIRDSLFRDETSRLIAQSEAQFGLERKENENRQLRAQNRINDLKIENAKIEIRNRQQFTYGVIGFGVLLAGSGFFYFKKRQTLQELKAQNRVRKAEEQQRVAISHELHDNVGAQLSYIVSNLDMVQQQLPDDQRVKSVADMSRQAILTLRETVWALNNETVTTEVFADKFKQYVLKMLEFNPQIQCRFHEHMEQQILLRPMQALNLFRICQEAFSNAVRHSGTDNIDVHFATAHRHRFDLRIEDNGRGFIPEEGLAKGHFGLQNMQSRAMETGAIYRLESIGGKGTTVSITVQL